MNSKLVLSFAPDGLGSCFYTESIDLTAIGSLEVARATALEFNGSQQLWEVKQNDIVLFAHSSRKVCLDWEEKHFNQ